MPKARRALQAIDNLILALRRGHFSFTATECALMADDLAYARDLFSNVVIRRKAKQQEKTKTGDIRAVMQEDISRK